MRAQDDESRELTGEGFLRFDLEFIDDTVPHTRERIGGCLPVERREGVKFRCGRRRICRDECQWSTPSTKGGMLEPGCGREIALRVADEAGTAAPTRAPLKCQCARGNRGKGKNYFVG